MGATGEQGLRLLAGLIRIVCGVRPLGEGFVPEGPKVFFANHTSHLDFTLVWSVLPQRERLRTRPVAGRDYWLRNRLTRFAGITVFKAVLIERQHVTRTNNPMELMTAALKAGNSLIVFPEGTRHSDEIPGPFKGGLYHLALECPEVPLIPVYLENLNRMMPRGTFLPVPLISRITIGEPLRFRAEQGRRDEFLEQARQALIEISPWKAR